MEQKYYLLSLKWSKFKGKYVWWGADESGYYEDLNKAGIYTFDNKIPLRYMNDSTVAIPVNLVESLCIQRVVPTTEENWKQMNIDLDSLPEY